jgi:hypothetical protein
MPVATEFLDRAPLSEADRARIGRRDAELPLRIAPVETSGDPAEGR